MEEDDIRTWHKKPSAQGEGVKPPATQENFKKCWIVGAHMIKQFDEQESEEESEEDDEEKNVKPSKSAQQPGLVKATPQASLQDESEEYDEDDESEEGEENRQ